MVVEHRAELSESNTDALVMITKLEITFRTSVKSRKITKINLKPKTILVANVMS